MMPEHERRKRDKIEEEANTFAVLLLMPEHLLLPELKKGLDLGSDDQLKEICKKFQVTPTAFAYRYHLLMKKYPKGLPI
jgi:Zn-dependent peptidase ImmA (M78 family)